jgi:predicted helicase
VFSVVPVQRIGKVRRKTAKSPLRNHRKKVETLSRDLSRRNNFRRRHSLLYLRNFALSGLPKRFANNLSRELLRTTRVKLAVEFWKFSKAGRELTDLHINCEIAKKYPMEIVSKCGNLMDGDFSVAKMRYGESTIFQPLLSICLLLASRSNFLA